MIDVASHLAFDNRRYVWTATHQRFIQKLVRERLKGTMNGDIQKVMTMTL